MKWAWKESGMGDVSGQNQVREEVDAGEMGTEKIRKGIYAINKITQ